MRLMYLAISYLLICMPALVYTTAPDRPGPSLKQASPAVKMPELVGEWVIGSRYVIQQVGPSISIDAVTAGWAGKGAISDDRLSLTIDWTSPSGDSARGFYKIEKDGRLVGHWWYREEEKDGSPPKEALRKETIARPEPEIEFM